jgi:uncharacterized membrane protein YjdF
MINKVVIQLKLIKRLVYLLHNLIYQLIFIWLMLIKLTSYVYKDMFNSMNRIN